MFTPLGKFSAIVPCPKGEECSLLNCLFSHKPGDQPTAENNLSVLPQIQDYEGQRTPKRIKVEQEPTEILMTDLKKSLNNVSRPPSRVDAVASPSASSSKPAEPAATPAPASVSAPASASASDGVSTKLPPRIVPKESLNPRMLPKPPATHNVRLVLVTKLHEAMTRLNNRVAKELPSQICFTLTKQELIIMALDEEETMARESPAVYKNVIKLRIVKFTKMLLEDWIQEVMKHLNTRYYNSELGQQQKLEDTPPPINADLNLTVKDEIALANELVTPLKGLEEHGYVTTLPKEKDVESARKGIDVSKGWEVCDRCSTRFQVFPGRHVDGTLASGGECKYHPIRPSYPRRKRTDQITGSSDVYYPCCGEAVGASRGCTTAKTHVYKFSDRNRLAAVLQFKETPLQPDDKKHDPVSFDCEMGYTTLGMELVRLTAVSWPEGRELVDILVKPMGELLDLNSRYSGVFPEHYASATLYGTAVKGKGPLQETGGETKALQYVESPAAAREVLFSFLQPDTPLIGHAIDNDLNACRIIHPTVIDTVILYPHPRRLPMRMSLKALAKTYLKRDIQTGGDQGHDSKEDAIATGDLVRIKAGQKWKKLKYQGWKLQDGKLIAPPKS